MGTEDFEEWFDEDGDLDPGGVERGEPDDWSELHWHVDPKRRGWRFKSWEHAERHARHLNREHHAEAHWAFKVGHDELRNVCILRRWIGREDYLVDPPSNLDA